MVTHVSRKGEEGAAGWGSPSLHTGTDRPASSCSGAAVAQLCSSPDAAMLGRLCATPVLLQLRTGTHSARGHPGRPAAHSAAPVAQGNVWLPGPRQEGDVIAAERNSNQMGPRCSPGPQGGHRQELVKGCRQEAGWEGRPEPSGNPACSALTASGPDVARGHGTPQVWGGGQWDPRSLRLGTAS